MTLEASACYISKVASRQGWLGKIGERFEISSVKLLKCGACHFEQQERNAKAGSIIKVDTQSQGISKADKLKNGELIFSDQYVSSQPGKVFGGQIASISSQKYCGENFFMMLLVERLKSFIRCRSMHKRLCKLS